MAAENHDPHVLEAGHAPTPFTAAEIRDACRPGRTITVRVDADGETPFHRVTRFLECDDAGATFEQSRLSVDGAPLDEPEVDRVRWLDLQSHASFPAPDTTIEPERIDTTIGTLDCLRYTVRRGGSEHVFWFATGLPGMQVRMETRTDGRVVWTSAVVEHVRP